MAALSCVSGYALERLITLVWLRQLTDPSMPTVAGFDPRSLVGGGWQWTDPVFADGTAATSIDELIATASAQLAAIAPGGDLLVGEWAARVGEANTAQALRAVARWTPPAHHGPDLLGLVTQQHRSKGGKADLGSFYTPYGVSLMMAQMTGIQPGKTVCDPACGSGGMLLAALEVCREEHGGEPILSGCDIDPIAVRCARLNLILAGVGAQAAGGRGVHRADTLAGREILDAVERSQAAA